MFHLAILFAVPVYPYILTDDQAIFCVTEAANKYLSKYFRGISFLEFHDQFIQSQIISKLNSVNFVSNNVLIPMPRETDVLIVTSSVNFLIKPETIGRILIFINSSDTQQSYDLLYNWWNHHKNANVTIGIRSETAIQFYTYFPFIKNACSSEGNVHLLDKFVNGDFVNETNLFPVKVQDQIFGCPLKAVWRNADVSISESTDIEYHMLRILSRVHNFKIVQFPKGNESFWRVYINGKLTGPMKKLKDGVVDLVFGRLTLQLDRFRIAHPLYPHLQQSIVFLGPGPTIYANGFLKIFTGIPVVFWLIFFIFDVIGTLAVMCSRRLYKKSSFLDALLQITSIRLQQLTPDRPKSNSHRLIVISMIILSIHSFAFYSGGILYSLLIVKIDYPYKDILDLFRYRLRCYTFPMTDYVLNKYLNYLYNHTNTTDRGRCRLSEKPIKEVMIEVAVNRSAYILYPKESADYFLERDELHDNYTGLPLLNILKPAFQTRPVSFYMPYGHPLTELLQDTIQQMVEGGFFEAWQVPSVAKYKNVANNKGTSLNFRQLFGFFSIVLFLLGVCFLAFVGEIIVFRFKQKKNKAKFNNLK